MKNCKSDMHQLKQLCHRAKLLCIIGNFFPWRVVFLLLFGRFVFVSKNPHELSITPCCYLPIGRYLLIFHFRLEIYVALFQTLLPTTYYYKQRNSSNTTSIAEILCMHRSLIHIFYEKTLTESALQFVLRLFYISSAIPQKTLQLKRHSQRHRCTKFQLFLRQLHAVRRRNVREMMLKCFFKISRCDKNLRSSLSV